MIKITTCEHKTSRIVLEGSNYYVAICDWGCDEYLLVTSENGVIHEQSISDMVIELAALRRVADAAKRFNSDVAQFGSPSQESAFNLQNALGEISKLKGDE